MSKLISCHMVSKEYIIIWPNTQIMVLCISTSTFEHTKGLGLKTSSNEHQIKQTIFDLFVYKYAAESKLMTMNSDVVKDSAFILILLACSGVFINQVIVCINRYISMDTSVATELERYHRFLIHMYLYKYVKITVITFCTYVFSAFRMLNSPQ